MEKDELIERAYKAFSNSKKPNPCTKGTDFEEADFNDLLLSATRRSLSIEQVGTVAWSPIPLMVPEALAYFMPRLIELAITKAIDCDGDPFFCYFINSFHDGPDSEKFELFGPEQKKVMADAFNFLCQTYDEQLKVEGWFDEACQAMKDWNNT
jgi:hypothetical protein